MNNKIYNKKFTHGILLASVSDPYSLNPDPAKNLNSDPSYFLTISENKLKLLHKYKKKVN